MSNSAITELKASIANLENEFQLQKDQMNETGSQLNRAKKALSILENSSTPTVRETGIADKIRNYVQLSSETEFEPAVVAKAVGCKYINAYQSLKKLGVLKVKEAVTA